MVVGDKDYQLSISRLAVSFRGALSMEYLQGAGMWRIQELNEHSKTIAEEIKADG